MINENKISNRENNQRNTRVGIYKSILVFILLWLLHMRNNGQPNKDLHRKILPTGIEFDALMNAANLKIFASVWQQRAESLRGRLRFRVCNIGILNSEIWFCFTKIGISLLYGILQFWTIYSTCIFQLTTKSDGAMQHLTRKSMAAHNYNFSFQLFVEKKI